MALGFDEVLNEERSKYNDADGGSIKLNFKILPVKNQKKINSPYFKE